jgi:putative endonuclease
MFYVYLLESGYHRYIGITKNLKRRIKEHNAGKNFATRPYVPWGLIYFEAHTNFDDASRREVYFKTSQGRMALGRMLRSYNQTKSFSNRRSTTRKE